MRTPHVVSASGSGVSGLLSPSEWSPVPADVCLPPCLWPLCLIATWYL